MMWRRVRPLAIAGLASLSAATPSIARAQPGAVQPSPVQQSVEDEGEEDAIPLLDDGVSSPEDDSMTAESASRGRRQESAGAKPAPRPDARSVQAPPPEFPYPGASEPGFRRRGPITEAPDPTPNPALPRPKRVTEDGQYFYDVGEPVESRSTGVLPTPEGGVNRDGSWDFGSPPKPAVPPNPIPGAERPVEVTSSGYQYKVETSKESGSASLRFGFIAAPSLKNSKNRADYRDIYGGNMQAAFLADYEFRFLSSLGRMGLKIGSGISTASGQGRFVDPQVAAAWDKAEEQFTFLIFPNTLTLSYRFQYWKSQFLIPFIEGGGGYYTFMELRDDDKGPKFGASPVGVASGGLLLNLNFVDRGAISRLDNDYGINNVYLVLEARAVVGLNQKYDFTSTLFNGGIVADF